MTPILSVDRLKTYFNTSIGLVRAVDDVSLTVPTGKTVGLVGESGSGKSATALSVIRLVRPPGRTLAGRVIFKGKNLLELSDQEIQKVRGKEISMVFQDPLTFLNPVFKVGGQIGEAIRLHQGATGTEIRERVERVMESVRISDRATVADYYPHQLSGGMRQRIVIATAISCDPSLLIADEPTTALDVTIQMQILDLLKDLQKRLGMSMLIITHDLGIVAGMCDEVNIMYAGKILEHAPVDAVFDDPRHPYTQALLSSILRSDVFKENIPTIPGRVPDLIDPPSGCRFHPRCKHTMDRCRKEEPPQVSPEKGREVACWLWSDK